MDSTQDIVVPEGEKMDLELIVKDKVVEVCFLHHLGPAYSVSSLVPSRFPLAISSHLKMKSLKLYHAH